MLTFKVKDVKIPNQIGGIMAIDNSIRAKGITDHKGRCLPTSVELSPLAKASPVIPNVRISPVATCLNFIIAASLSK